MIPKFEFFIALLKNSSTFASGKSYTTSSHELPQGRKAARVSGCSGAIYSAYPFFYFCSGRLSNENGSRALIDGYTLKSFDPARITLN